MNASFAGCVHLITCFKQIFKNLVTVVRSDTLVIKKSAFNLKDETRWILYTKKNQTFASVINFTSIQLHKDWNRKSSSSYQHHGKHSKYLETKCWGHRDSTGFKCLSYTQPILTHSQLRAKQMPYRCATALAPPFVLTISVSVIIPGGAQGTICCAGDQNGIKCMQK